MSNITFDIFDMTFDEVWKTIPDYEGFYEASDWGNVRSLDRWVDNYSDGRKGRFFPGVVLAQDASEGYPRVRLKREGFAKTWLVHQLVLLAHRGPCPPGMWALHWDDSPTNNHISNLRYDTPSANARDQVRNGRHRNASKVACSRGHAFAGSNLYINGTSGSRQCRTCSNITRAARRRLLSGAVAA